MAKNLAFARDDYVVYPSHGVGRIIRIETQEIAGDLLEMYVVSFEQDRLILRVPVGKAPKSGMRKLSSRDKIQTAMNALKARPKPQSSRPPEIASSMPISPATLRGLLKMGSTAPVTRRAFRVRIAAAVRKICGFGE